MRREIVLIIWRNVVANIKSQIKRNRQNDKKRLRNRVYRGEARIAVRTARTNIDEGTPESKAALLEAISTLDKAAEQGVIHKNNAARRKSRLMKAFAKMGPVPVEAAPAAGEPMLEPNPLPRRRLLHAAHLPARWKSRSWKPLWKQGLNQKAASSEGEEDSSSLVPKGKKPTAKKLSHQDHRKEKITAAKKNPEFAACKNHVRERPERRASRFFIRMKP